jgi:hypothetical protein
MEDRRVMDFARLFWSRCNDAEPVFSADELQWAPPEELDRFRERGLLREAALATRAMCDACDEGHLEDVVWLHSARTGRLEPFLACPENGGAPVDVERLRRWAIARDRIAAELREQLGLIGSASVLVPGLVWSLGRRHLAGRFRDFFFVCGPASRCNPIGDAPSPVILVPDRTTSTGIPPTGRIAILRLADVATFEDARLVVDLPYLEDAVPRDSHAVPAKTVVSFPVPPDARWDEVHLTIRDASVLAELRGERREFTPNDLGLAGPNDRLWQLLCLFARQGGQTPPRKKPASDKDGAALRKHVSNLRQRLAMVFPIEGEPIRSVHGTGAYRCLFRIQLDRREGFPWPPEHWEDCEFTELPDGRIRISVQSREVYAARAVAEESGRRTAIEAAERLGIRTEDYDLRTLGLADSSGVPSAEGRVLVELLRHDGKLTRRGDDKEVLRLAQRLCTWMGVEGEPFRFSPRDNRWALVAACRSYRAAMPTLFRTTRS